MYHKPLQANLWLMANLTISRASRTRERSPIAKKIWLPIRPRRFSSHETVRRPAPLGNQCKMLLFLSIVGACNLILHVHVVNIDNCQNRVSADQYHMTLSRAQVSTHRDDVFFLSLPLTGFAFSTDRRLNSD